MKGHPSLACVRRLGSAGPTTRASTAGGTATASGAVSSRCSLFSGQLRGRGVREAMTIPRSLLGSWNPSPQASRLEWSSGGPCCWPASAAQNHTLLRRVSAGRLCAEPRFSACQKFTRRANKHKTQPKLNCHPSPGIPNTSPAASGHTTNDPQLLLHNAQPTHHHATVPPAAGQHHPTVCPGPAPALLQLPATAAAAKVSTPTVDRSLVEVGALGLLTTVSQVVSPGGLGSGRSQKDTAVYRCEIHLCGNGGSRGLWGGLSSGEPQAESSPLSHTLVLPPGPTAMQPSTGARWQNSGCKRRRRSGGNRSSG